MNLENMFFISVVLYSLAILTYLLPEKMKLHAHKIAHIATFSAGALLVYITTVFFLDPKLYNDQLVFVHYAEFSLLIDAWSGFFLFIIALISSLVTIYSYSYTMHYKEKSLQALVSLGSAFILSMVLVVVAHNILGFLFFWELMAISSFLLVNHEHEKAATWHAAFQYLIMTTIGTMSIMAAFFILSSANLTLDFSTLSSYALSLDKKNLVFILAFFGFAIKAGLVPVHIWLPQAHPAAPSHISALMSAVMLKIAVYGFGRFIFDFFHTLEPWWGVTVLIIGLVSGFTGALFLQMENGIKSILAYSSIENLGIIFTALGVGMIFTVHKFSTLAFAAYLAAVVHILAHSIMKSLLFLTAGSIVYKTNDHNIEHMGGLIKYMPSTAKACFVGVMAISALPFFNGFVGEWLLFQNIIALPRIGENSYGLFLAIISIIIFSLTGALALGGFARFYGIIFLGSPRVAKLKNITEVGFLMRIVPIILALLCFITGVYTNGVIIFCTRALAGLQLPKYFIPVITTDTTIVFQGLYDSAYAPVIMLIIVGIICFTLIYNITRPSHIEHSAAVWSCGIYPNSRMQYSATGFSKPIRRLFTFILRPYKEYKFIKIQNARTQIVVNIAIKDMVTDRLYAPIQKSMIKTATILRKIQTGGLQTYIAYIMLTMIVILLWGTLWS